MRLTFDHGRATIDLADGTTLSVINSDRNDLIRERKKYSPSAILHGWSITDALCDDENGLYEVAIIDTETEGCRSDISPPLLSAHRIDDDGWVIYKMVPVSTIELYVTQVGIK